MVHFVGAGPGAVDLITIRGKRLIEDADVIIYAGSLVNPYLLEFARKDCKIHNSAKMTLDEVISVMKEAEDRGHTTVRLHTGDPSLYGAVREQMDRLSDLGIEYDSTPGVSSFCAAAASLDMEYTLPGITQSVIITRMEGRTPVPQRESVEALSVHGATMVFFLSAGEIGRLAKRLIDSGRDVNTPCAIVYKASWEDEKKIVCTLSDAEAKATEMGINKTALIIVGEAVSQSGYEKSRLYAPEFTTGFRKGSDKDE